MREKGMHSEFCYINFLKNVHLIDQEGSERKELRLTMGETVRVGGGWNCHQIVSNGGFFVLVLLKFRIFATTVLIS
jgi:hypothetical protein